MTQPAIETASWAARVGALFVDWLASMLVVVTILGPAGWSTNPWSGAYTSCVFVLESAVFTALAGGSFGKLCVRLRVIRADLSGPLDLLRALLRSILVVLVIPPLVFRPDGRGLHDMAVGSMTVPLSALRSPA